jgi:hypothetical protein
MPWTEKNPPAVAKNWTRSEKRRCVAAANAVLKGGKSEQEAIYACIHAAGKSNKAIDNDAYYAAVEDGLTVFQDLIRDYFAGLITLTVLKKKFNEALELYFVELMTLGLDGKDPTQIDVDFVNGKIKEHSGLFDIFLADLAEGKLSENRALWRAGLYATDREAYIFYTVPNAIAALMEGLPGEICYGNGLCGCSLDVQFDNEGNATVFWIIDPQKESCEACLDMAGRSPFYFTRAEIEAVNG